MHQAFSNLFYDDFKDEIQTDWDVEQGMRGVTAGTTPSIAFKNDFMKAQLKKASPEVVQQVEEHRQRVHREEVEAYNAAMAARSMLTPEERELDDAIQEALVTLRSRQRSV